MDADVLKSMFDASQQNHGPDSKFTPEEANRFRKAFEDPEFRKMFSEYMDELQDPKHREETEAYISQLEGEQKVPEGKELIRPLPGFVAKTHKIKEAGKDVKEKMFINVVQSEKIAKPTKQSTPKGDCWSIPYSVGPPHMEKDKKGENSPCFDCCFHPEALILSEANADFKNLLVTTAMDGVEALYKRQEQDVKLDRQFHVVKGVSYKEGVVPTMMLAVANKDAWKEKEGKKSSSSTGKQKQIDSSDVSLQKQKDVDASPSKSKLEDKPKTPAIKKGFLNSAKTSLYPEKIPTIRPKSGSMVQEPPKEPTDEEKQKQIDEIIKEMEKASLESQEPAKISTRDVGLSDTMKAVSTKLKAKQPEEASTTDSERRPAVPLVVCKHREASSMGDFEAMKSQQVSSRRPTELIYEINLPLVTTPSKIILDVSEKKLVLSYTDVYKLEMDLPFKVYDKKGKAAYDKTKKVLKVTLPVEQEQVKPISSQSVSSSSSIQEVSPTKEKAVPPVRSFSTTSTIHQPVEKHGRWVENSVENTSPKKKVTEVTSNNNEEEELSESKKLFLEVQRQAELAKKKYLEEQQSQQQVESSLSPQKSKETPVKSIESKKESSGTIQSNAANFIAASSFQGAKKGYVFKRGDDGLGYYLDTKQSSSHTKNDLQEDRANKEKDKKIVDKTVAPPPPKSHAPVTPTFLKIPYDVKINQDTISLLFQVKNIIPDSVNIDLQQYSFAIQFQTLDTISNDSAKQVYGMQFLLDKAVCTDGLSTQKFKFDVASKNMVLVVGKGNRDAEWDEDTNPEWLTGKILSSMIASDDNNSRSTEESKSNAAATSEKYTPTKDVNATNALKSIISTMKFSTDFVSELD